MSDNYLDSKFFESLRPVDYNPLRDGRIISVVKTNSSQQEIWSSLILDEKATLCYNEAVVIELNELLDDNILQQSIFALIQAHPALRSSFSSDGSVQFIHDQVSANNIKIKKFKASDAKESIHLKQVIMSEEMQTPFNLLSGPFLRMSLITENSFKQHLILTIHHIVCDGWSLNQLINDLTTIYKQIKNNNYQFKKPYDLEKIKTPKTKSDSLLFWKNEINSLSQISPFTLPTDYERPLFRTFESERLDIKVSAELVKKIRNYLGQYQTSLYAFMCATFKLALFEHAQNKNVCIGVTIAAQMNNESIAKIIGHHVNILPIKSLIDTNLALSQYFTDFKNQFEQVIKHSDCTFNELVKMMKSGQRSPGISPLISIVFNIDQIWNEEQNTFSNSTFSIDTVARKYENFEMFVNMKVRGTKSITFEIQYNSNLFNQNKVEKLFSTYFNFLDKISEVKYISDLISVIHRLSALVQQEPITTKIENINFKTSEKILNIWKMYLKNQTISSSDNFFNIGGHSLLALSIAKEIEKTFDVKFTIKDVFLNATVDKMSIAINNLKTIDPPFEKVVVEYKDKQLNFSNLNISQQQIYFLEKMFPGIRLNNLPAAIEIEEFVELSILKSSLKVIMNNHPSLRTIFESKNGKIIQTVLDMDDILDFNVDVVSLRKDDISSELQKYALETFDLSQAPLMKAKVILSAGNKCTLFFNFHHIIWDGGCFDLFFEELNQVYSGLLSNINYTIRCEDKSYFDYIDFQEAYLKSNKYQQDLQYWKNIYSNGVKKLQLPYDRLGINKNSFDADCIPILLSHEQIDQLISFSRKNSTSVYNIMLTAFKLTLAKYSQCEEIIVGVPVQNRPDSRWKYTTGFFVNTLPIKSEFSLRENFLDILQTVQNNCLSAYEHQSCPFFDIQKYAMSKNANQSVNLQAFFSYQDVQNRSGKFNQIKYHQINVSNLSAHTDLDLWVKFSETKVEGGLHFKKDLFDKSTVENMLEYYLHIIDQCLVSPNCPINQIQLPLNQKNKLIDWGKGPVLDNLETNKSLSVVDLFLKQASKLPEKNAVHSRDLAFNYSDLDNLSTSLAIYLQQLGIVKGSKVGLCIGRNSYIPVAILAILKCGGIYVPLDPSFPIERLNYIKDTAELDIIISELNFKNLFKNDLGKIIFIEELVKINILSTNVKIFSKIQVYDTDIAYIIFTSGSTGQPKGVQVSHLALTNFIRSMCHFNFCQTTDHILALTTVSFDISILELLLPLTTGAQVYIGDKIDLLDAS